MIRRPMKTLSIAIGVLLLASALGAVAFLAPGTEDDDDRLGVVVTISPQKEFARAVGGDRVKVNVMVPSGKDPHSYEPTTGQMKDVARAELYFKVGSGVEFEKVWMDKIRDQNSDMLIVDGSKGVELIPMSGAEKDTEEVAKDLFVHGPFEEFTAGENESASPFIEGGYKCYNLTFNEEDGNWSGMVRFAPGEGGEYVVFLEHDREELNFTLTDEEGTGIDPEEHDHESRSEHEENGEEHIFHWHAGFHLDMENHTLGFGPTGERSCKVAILEEHGEADEHDLSMSARGDDSGPGHDHGDIDPHIWLSPINAGIMVENLLAGLIEVDPDNSAYYTANARDYIAELDGLHANMTGRLEPHRGKKFMVYHPSFGYLAHAYGLEQLAVEDEGKAPTEAGLQSLIEQAKDENIRVVFVSPEFDDHNARVIADEIDGDVASMDPLAGDYLENMAKIGEELVRGLS